MTDIQLFYEELGSGEPMLLLHGNGEEHGYFRHQMECFSKSHRVIAIDTRGHGKSPMGEKEFSIKQFAQDLDDFMVEMGLEKAIILGFSDGANIAMEFALAHRDKVSKLILNGGNIEPCGVKAIYQIPTVLEYWWLNVLGIFTDRMRQRKMLLRLMVKEPHITPTQLATLNMPTLVIAGTNDMIRESHTKLIASSIPNSVLKIIPGDHFVAAKNPLCFNEAVKSFIYE